MNMPSKEELSNLAGRLDCGAKILRDLASEQEPEDVAERLDGRSIMIRVETEEDGELFSWVGPRKIAEAIKSELGVNIQPNQVILSESFHELGVYDVSLHLKGIPKIKVWIVEDAPDEPNKHNKPEQEEQPETKIIVINPGRRHIPQCPFWTGAGSQRHCGICPPNIKLGQCFGAIPVWCPLPVLVRLKTDDEDIAAQPAAKEPEEPKVKRTCQTCKHKRAEVGDSNCATCVTPDLWLWKPQSEESKVESLREAADRFGHRLGHGTVGGKARDQADLCAIVLRHTDRLAELMRLHFEGTSSWNDIDKALQGERAEMAQRIEGSE